MKKRCVFAVLFFLCTAVLPAAPFAQTGRRTMASCLTSDCIPVEKLGLSEEQKESIQRIENLSNEKMLGLRSELMSKRFELQALFRNPQADEKQIRAKAQDVMELQSKCQAMTIDCQMKIRAILTPEQLQIWCASTDSCFVKSWIKEP